MSEAVAYSLSDALSLVTPYLSAGLISVQARAGIEALAKELPFNRQVAFEARLDRDDAQVDLAQLFGAEQSERQALLRFTSQERFKADPRWELLRAFCEAWTDERSALHDRVEFAWLEYDLPIESVTTLPVLAPSIFLGLPRRDRLSASATIDQVLKLFGRQDAVLAPLQTQLERCIREMPDSAEVFSVGMMLSRQINAVRLPVHYVGKQEAVDYLRRIGWKGPIELVKALLERYFDLSERIALDLDVGAEIYPQIGIEFHLGDHRPGDARINNLFDRLDQAGLCAPEKRESLLSWPGIQTPGSDHERWPSNMLVQALLRGFAGSWVLARGISHVKLVCKADQSVTAKIYFGYLIDWIAHTV